MKPIKVPTRRPSLKNARGILTWLTSSRIEQTLDHTTVQTTCLATQTAMMTSVTTPEDKGNDDALKSSGKAGTDKVGAEASFKANDGNNDNDDDSTDDEEPIEVVGVVCSGSNKENEVGHATGAAATNKMKGAGEEKKDEPKKGNDKMEASDETKKRPSTIPLSVKKKKNKAATNKKKGKGELDDPFTLEVVKCFALNSEKKEATELIRSKELHRHNKAMEDLATRDQDWKERQSDFDFKVKRLTQYHELKAKFDVDFIRSVFPEMKRLHRCGNPSWQGLKTESQESS